jgi:uncharacterized protein YneF (UPF0154 family)
MKKVVLILFIIDIIGFISGFLMVQNNYNRGHLIIGLSLIALMFIIVPIFLYMRYSKKQLDDFVYKKDD